MVEIVVRGEAVERAAAERATVTVHSRWQADEPETAMAAVTEAHAGVVAQARELESTGAVESWHAERVRVSHHREWVGEGQPQRLVFSASAAVTATFLDVDALGAWIGRVGAQHVHEIGGISWSLAEGTQRELASRARARAVDDAVARAVDYARAAGLGTPAITGLREPETSPPIPFAVRGGGVESLMIGSADAGGPVELSAGEIEVVAIVEASFEAERDQTGG